MFFITVLFYASIIVIGINVISTGLMIGRITEIICESKYTVFFKKYCALCLVTLYNFFGDI